MCVVGVSDGWKVWICYWSNGLLSYYPIRYSAYVSLFSVGNMDGIDLLYYQLKKRKVKRETPPNIEVVFPFVSSAMRDCISKTPD